MINVILVIHLLLAVALVGVILLQRSEGGALGMGGGGGGLMSGRAAGNLLTRATAIIAGLFIATSLTLALLANTHAAPKPLMDGVSLPLAPAIPGLPTTGGEAPKDTNGSVPSAK